MKKRITDVFLVIYFLLIFLVVCLAISCKQNEETREIKLKVLIDKTKETVSATALSSGKTTYLLAFNDGHTEKTTFGYYSCLNIGDTVSFVKGKNDVWWKMIPNCK